MGDNYFVEVSIQALNSIEIPIWIKIFSLSVIILCVLVIIIFNYRMNNLKKPLVEPKGTPVGPLPPVKGNSIAARWQEIENHSKSDREGEWKFAIIEADKLVGDILAEIGVPGDTLGEKLIQINSSQLASIDDLWEAHKVRNKIAHDTQYFLRDVEARRIIRLFEKVLRELEAL